MSAPDDPPQDLRVDVPREDVLRAEALDRAVRFWTGAARADVVPDDARVVRTAEAFYGFLSGGMTQTRARRPTSTPVRCRRCKTRYEWWHMVECLWGTGQKLGYHEPEPAGAGPGFLIPDTAYPDPIPKGC
jgi:hypothetical protein